MEKFTFLQIAAFPENTDQIEVRISGEADTAGEAMIDMAEYFG